MSNVYDMCYSELIVLGNGISDMSVSVADYFVQMFRRYQLHRNEREAVWSYHDQLITLQLIAAQQNKQV